MGAPVHEREAMIGGMDPDLRPGIFHFCTIPDADAGELLPQALGSFREAEGLSLILPEALARARGCPLDDPMRQITLQVHSALGGVGLTAAVAGALAEAGIACNMVAARHHDHAFVPAARAEEALEALRALAAQAARAVS